MRHDSTAFPHGGPPMSYQHTQRSPLALLVLAIAAGMVVVAWVVPGPPPVFPILHAVAALLVVAACSFRTLTIRDAGSQLLVRFGPIPLFRMGLDYHLISEPRVAKSSLIDGWGIHWVPGRGMTYNVWGFDCVEMRVGKRLIRLGSDDAVNLAEFVRQRIAQV